MRTYLYCEAGFVEKAQWLPNSWVNVVCPDSSDFKFLTETLKVPESFLNDIADTDERPRTEAVSLIPPYPSASSPTMKSLFLCATIRRI